MPRTASASTSSSGIANSERRDVGLHAGRRGAGDGGDDGEHAGEQVDGDAQRDPAAALEQVVGEPRVGAGRQLGRVRDPGERPQRGDRASASCSRVGTEKAMSWK